MAFSGKNHVLSGVNFAEKNSKRNFLWQPLVHVFVKSIFCVESIFGRKRFVKTNGVH